nr:MAG TPA: hypothetical protein [Caudoviricetes sp.]
MFSLIRYFRPGTNPALCYHREQTISSMPTVSPRLRLRLAASRCTFHPISNLPEFFNSRIIFYPVCSTAYP